MDEGEVEVNESTIRMLVQVTPNEEMTEEELDELVAKRKNRVLGEYVSGLLDKAKIEEL